MHTLVEENQTLPFLKLTGMFVSQLYVILEMIFSKFSRHRCKTVLIAKGNFLFVRESIECFEHLQ